MTDDEFNDELLAHAHGGSTTTTPTSHGGGFSTGTCPLPPSQITSTDRRSTSTPRSATELNGLTRPALNGFFFGLALTLTSRNSWSLRLASTGPIVSKFTTDQISRADTGFSITSAIRSTAAAALASALAAARAWLRALDACHTATPAANTATATAPQSATFPQSTELTLPVLDRVFPPDQCDDAHGDRALANYLEHHRSAA